MLSLRIYSQQSDTAILVLYDTVKVKMIIDYTYWDDTPQVSKFFLTIVPGLRDKGNYYTRRFKV